MARWQSRDVFGCLLLLLVITGQILGAMASWVRLDSLVVSWLARWWAVLGQSRC